MILGKYVNKIINVFTGMFGIATLILMLIMYLNNMITFLPAQGAINVSIARNYLTLATVFCAGAEFTFKRNIFLAIIFAAIVVAVAALMIYSDVAV